MSPTKDSLQSNLYEHIVCYTSHIVLVVLIAELPRHLTKHRRSTLQNQNRLRCHRTTASGVCLTIWAHLEVQGMDITNAGIDMKSCCDMLWLTMGQNFLALSPCGVCWGHNCFFPGPFPQGLCGCRSMQSTNLPGSPHEILQQRSL